MKTGTDLRKEQIMYVVLGVFMLGICIYVYEEIFAGGSSSPAPQTTVVSAPAAPQGGASGPAAKKVGTTSAGLDPTLHMEGMLASEAVVYLGTGRNIFSQNSAPAVPIPSPIAKARPLPAVVQNVAPPARTGPPPPPPIDLKFFGLVTSADGKREAFLLHGDSVFTASAGDVVMRRYRVISIDPRSIHVEDMQNNNNQTLPLLMN